MFLQKRIGNTLRWIAQLIVVVMMVACNGDDGTAEDGVGAESGGTGKHSIGRSEFLEPYIVRELDIDDDFDPRMMQVDEQRGVLYVPQGSLGAAGTDGSSLVAFDMATGRQLAWHGIGSRISSSIVKLADDDSGLATVVSGFQSVAIEPLGDRGSSIGVNTDTQVDELVFNQEYLFVVDETRTAIYQYDIANNTLLGSVEGLQVDDWLVAFASQKLFVLSDSEVTEYDFSEGLARATWQSRLHYESLEFGWLNPEESLLYQSNGAVYSVPKFELELKALESVANRRRSFVDIAFNEGGDKHYTAETYYGDGVGDVFLSPLKLFQAEALGLAAQRVFVSSLGVHAYVNDGGQHKLYWLKQNVNEPRSFTRLEPMNIANDFGAGASTYRGYRLEYPAYDLQPAWQDLSLRFEVREMQDYYKSERIVIEPICFNEGCASGTYEASIPLERVPMHFTVRLSEHIQVNNFSGLQGFRVRTEAKSWDTFQLEDVYLTASARFGCGDATPADALSICD